MARTEVLTLSGQDNHPHLVVSVGQVEGCIDLVDELGVLGVGHLGSIKGDSGHMACHLVDDRFELRRAVVRQGRLLSAPSFPWKTERALPDDGPLDFTCTSED